MPTPLPFPIATIMRPLRRVSANKPVMRTLPGIPHQVFKYRLGNRGALEWVIDQYSVTEDPRSGLRSDPNNPADPEAIVRLVGQVGQVVRASLETVGIVEGLPALAVTGDRRSDEGGE